MGVEIKLTDRELPISPMMIEFLDRTITGKPQEAVWPDQLSETLVPGEAAERIRYANEVSDRVLNDPLGQKAILRAYELFAAISIGTTSKLRDIHDRYRFICVVGCPRHGGSYLTKELFLAIGHEPEKVPNVIAHDGFPDISPFILQEGTNGHTAAAQHMAEYLAMAEVFFARSFRDRDGFTVVPKKATKAAYDGAFFGAALGPRTEYIITLRHPVAACISTYEKSTGLPLDGRFAARGNIEDWVKRDLAWLGLDEGAIARGDYFDAYLRYWEHYHYRLALTGLPAGAGRTIVAYGKERLMGLAAKLRGKLDNSGAPGEFKVFDYRSRHAEWSAKATGPIARVAQVWKSAGWNFPVDEVMEGW